MKITTFLIKSNDTNLTLHINSAQEFVQRFSANAQFFHPCLRELLKGSIQIIVGSSNSYFVDRLLLSGGSMCQIVNYKDFDDLQDLMRSTDCIGIVEFADEPYTSLGWDWTGSINEEFLPNKVRDIPVGTNEVPLSLQKLQVNKVTQ